MKYLLRNIMLLSLPFIVITNVYAKNVYSNRNANSGKVSSIAMLQSWHDHDCSRKMSSIDVISKPKFGIITVKILKNTKIGRNRATSANNCAGKLIDALGIYYKSKKNFRGLDKFKIQSTPPKNSTDPIIIYNYKVKVR